MVVVVVVRAWFVLWVVVMVVGGVAGRRSDRDRDGDGKGGWSRAGPGTGSERRGEGEGEGEGEEEEGAAGVVVAGVVRVGGGFNAPGAAFFTPPKEPNPIMAIIAASSESVSTAI